MKVLVHCKGGLGRAGTFAARLLVEFGHTPASAIATVRTARPGALETLDQEACVATGRSSSRGEPVTRDRGTVRPCRRRPGRSGSGRRPRHDLGVLGQTPYSRYLTDIVGGGPFRLAPGDWTDDTAMALADSLQHEPALDPGDLMSRFLTWSPQTDTPARALALISARRFVRRWSGSSGRGSPSRDRRIALPQGMVR